DGDTDRVALLLQDLSVMQELGPRLRHLEPRLLEVHHVIGGRERHPEPRHGFLARSGMRAFPGKRIPAAVLLAELVDAVADVGVMVLVEDRISVARQDQIVAGLRLGLRRELRGELQMRDGIDADGDAGLLAEHLGLSAELVIRGGNEVVPGQEGELAFLSVGRRLAEGEPGGHPGGRTGALVEKLPTSHRTRSSGVHAGSFACDARFLIGASEVFVSPPRRTNRVPPLYPRPSGLSSTRRVSRLSWRHSSLMLG